MYKKKLLALLSVVALSLLAFSSCSGKDEAKDVPSEVQENTDQSKNAETESKEEVKGKYSDNEVYKGDDGKEYSKTEDGTEVEITGDNFQALLEEYEKVKGTGSEREKELLDQIQVIMDIMSAKQPQ